MRGFGFGMRAAGRRPGLIAGPPPRPVLLVVLAGQSNMEGRPGSAREAQDGAVAGAWQFAGDSGAPGYRTLTSAIAPLWHYATTADGGPWVGPGEYIARKLLADDPTADVVLVPVARGSTRLLIAPQEWLSSATPGAGGYLFENMIAQANRAYAAVAAQFPGRPVTVRLFWSQGEFDASGGITRAQYAGALSDLVVRFRARVTGAASAAVVVGSLIPERWQPASPNFDAGYGAINAGQVDVSVALPDVRYVAGPDYTSGGRDFLHYQPIQRVRDYGTALAAALSDRSGPTMTSPATGAEASGRRLAFPLTGSDRHQTFLIDGGADAARFELSDPYVNPLLRWVGNGVGPGAGSYQVGLRARDGAGNSGPVQLVTIAVTAAGAVSPATFFSGGERGMVWDLSDPTTLFQDVAGTVPVTATGQPVGRVLDRSPNGNHWIAAANDGSRPTYQVDADGQSYLRFDGADDVLFAAVPYLLPNAIGLTVTMGLRAAPGGAKAVLNAYSATNAIPFLNPLGAFNSSGGCTIGASNDFGSGGGNLPQLPNLFDDTRKIATVRYSGPNTVNRMREAANRGAAGLNWDSAVGQGSFGLPVSVTRAGLGATVGPTPAYFHNGRIYSGYVINRVLTDAEIRNGEDWVAARTAVILP